MDRWQMNDPIPAPLLPRKKRQKQKKKKKFRRGPDNPIKLTLNSYKYMRYIAIKY